MIFTMICCRGQFFSRPSSIVTRSSGSSSNSGFAAAVAYHHTTTASPLQLRSLRRLHHGFTASIVCSGRGGGGGGGGGSTLSHRRFPVDHSHYYYNYHYSHQFHNHSYGRSYQPHLHLHEQEQQERRRSMVTLMERATRLRQLAEQREQQEQGQQHNDDDDVTATTTKMKLDATLDGKDDASSYSKKKNGGGDGGSDDGDPAVMAIFDEMDLNGDGVISREEFKIAVEKMRDLDLRRMKRSLAVNDIALNYKGAALGRHVIVSDQFNAWQFIKCLPEYEHVKHLCPPVKLPPPLPGQEGRYTLVLDMDETLLHCSPDREESVHDPDHTFTIRYQGRSFPIHAWIRPKLFDFLDKIHGSQKFEVVIFTASQPEYANAMLDIIDPNNKYFHHRLFRDSCMNIEGSGSSSSYVKDLNVLGRDLSKCILVDNSPHVFGYNLDNGIPISSWYDDRQDNELEKLEWFLRQVGGEGIGGGGEATTTIDVRTLIREKFQCYKLVENAVGFAEDNDDDSGSNDGGGATSKIMSSSQKKVAMNSTNNGSPIASASKS